MFIYHILKFKIFSNFLRWIFATNIYFKNNNNFDDLKIESNNNFVEKSLIYFKYQKFIIEKGIDIKIKDWWSNFFLYIIVKKKEILKLGNF